MRQSQTRNAARSNSSQSVSQSVSQSSVSRQSVIMTKWWQPVQVRELELKLELELLQWRLVRVVQPLRAYSSAHPNRAPAIDRSIDSHIQTHSNHTNKSNKSVGKRREQCVSGSHTADPKVRSVSAGDGSDEYGLISPPPVSPS